MNLYSRAVRLLALRSHSRQELETKLVRSAEQSEVQAVLEKLESNGLLDDRSFACERAGHLGRTKHWGDRRIAQDLFRRGVSREFIQEAISRSSENLQEEDRLRTIIAEWKERHGPPSGLSDKKRLFDHCRRFGYPPALIRQLTIAD